MPERIPELDRLAYEAQEVTMLPASEIRRRGNRRRTTRHVAVGGVVAALALTAGFGVWQSPLLEQFRNPQWANTAVPETPVPTDDATSVPSETPTQVPTQEPTETETETEPTVDPTATPTETGSSASRQLTFANLPTAEMLAPDHAPMEIRDEHEGLGQAAKGLCDPGEYANPIATLTRSYGAPGYPAWIDAIGFSYDSPEAASTAFDLIKGAALNCTSAMETRANLLDPGVHDATAEVPFDASIIDADPVKMAYVTYAGLIPNSDYGMFGDTLVLQAGDRVLWITSAFEGQDNNCALTPDDENMDQCHVLAAIPEALKALSQ